MTVFLNNDGSQTMATPLGASPHFRWNTKLLPIKTREQRASTTARYRYDFGSAFQNLIAKCHLDVSFDDLRRSLDPAACQSPVAAVSSEP